MIDSHILYTVKRDLSQLDFSAENARIAALEREIEHMQDAVANAEARRTEIGAKLAELRHPELQRADVADALLEGISPSEAAASSKRRDELDEERITLREGVNELGRRIAAAQADIDHIKRAALHRARATAQPLIEALTEEARRSAHQMLSIYGSIVAVCSATKSGGPELQQVQRVVNDGIFADEQLLARGTPVVPSGEVLDALKSLADKGPALPFYGSILHN